MGTKQNEVSQIIGQKVGLDANAVANILKIAAALLMFFLGEEKRSQLIENSRELTNLLGGFLSGNVQKNVQSFVSQILNADGDGSVVDDLARMLLGGSIKNTSEEIGVRLDGFFK